jgi:hypothetical protein
MNEYFAEMDTLCARHLLTIYPRHLPYSKVLLGPPWTRGHAIEKRAEKLGDASLDPRRFSFDPVPTFIPETLESFDESPWIDVDTTSRTMSLSTFFCYDYPFIPKTARGDLPYDSAEFWPSGDLAGWPARLPGEKNSIVFGRGNLQGRAKAWSQIEKRMNKVFTTEQAPGTHGIGAVGIQQLGVFSLSSLHDR